jgi:hypothetical protein
MSAQILVILIEGFHDFPLSHQEMPEYRPWKLRSKSFPVVRSSVILPFDAVGTGKLIYKNTSWQASVLCVEVGGSSEILVITRIHGAIAPKTTERFLTGVKTSCIMFFFIYLDVIPIFWALPLI